MISEERLKYMEGQAALFRDAAVKEDASLQELLAEIRRLQAEVSALTVKLNTTVKADTTEADWRVKP